MCEMYEMRILSIWKLTQHVSIEREQSPTQNVDNLLKSGKKSYG